MCENKYSWNMKKLAYLSAVILIVTGCSSGSNGELVGVQDRTPSYSNPPYGMVLIPTGSYRMGPSDQDVPWATTAQSKTISVPSFWMDETEITNNEYRQFVYWVRDSMAYRLLGEQIDAYFISEDQYGEPIDPPFINWEEEINWAGEEEKTILEDLYYPEHERFYRRRDIDTRKLIFDYFWIDYKQAAQKYTFENENRRHYNYKTGQYDGEIYNLEGKRIPITISDNYGNELSTKVDVGVHTEFDIAQDEIYFNSCLENEKIKLLVNSKEQIFVEKIIPIIKFGLLSTRYKDFYDLYWLIKNGNMNKDEIIKIINNKIFVSNVNGIDSLEKLIEHINTILSDSDYLKTINNRKNNWLDISCEELKNTIVDYLSTIIANF